MLEGAWSNYKIGPILHQIHKLSYQATILVGTMRNENIVNVGFKDECPLLLKMKKVDLKKKLNLLYKWRGNCCAQNYQTISKEKYDLGLATKFAHMSLSN